MLRIKLVFVLMVLLASAGLIRRYRWYPKPVDPFGKAHNSWQWDEL